MTLPLLTTFMQTLYAAATNNGSALYLPYVASALPLPLEPLSVPGQAVIADLSTVSATLPTALCTAFTPGSIAVPGTTTSMTFTSIQWAGLSNVQPSQPSVNGSTVTFALQLGTATTLPPGPTLPAPVITAKFAIALACCASGDGSTCSGGSTPSPVTGTCTFALTGGTIGVTANVAPLDGSGALQPSTVVTVSGLTFSGTSVQATFVVDLISAGASAPAMSAALNAAFTSSATLSAIAPLITTGLNGAKVLAAAGQALTATFQSLANPQLLSFVGSMLYKALADPSNSLYLPKVLHGATDPTLDPYTVSGSWSLGDADALYPPAGLTICGGIGSVQGLSFINTPGQMAPLSLSDLVISNTSNTLPLPLLVINNTVYGMAVQGTVPGAAGPLTLAGGFSLQVSCCETVDSQTCSQPAQASTGTGTVNFTIASASIAGTILIGTQAGGAQLTASVQALTFRTDPNVINPKNMVCTVHIENVPDDQKPVWNPVAEQAFNSPQGATAVIEQVSTVLNSPGVISSLNEILTNALNNIAGAVEVEALRREIRQRETYSARAPRKTSAETP